jgi:hypothetical protein
MNITLFFSNDTILLKQIVHKTPVNTVEELKNQLFVAIRQNPDMLVRSQASMARRAPMCIDNGERHFEHLI